MKLKRETKGRAVYNDGMAILARFPLNDSGESDLVNWFNDLPNKTTRLERVELTVDLVPEDEALDV